MKPFHTGLLAATFLFGPILILIAGCEKESQSGASPGASSDAASSVPVGASAQPAPVQPVQPLDDQHAHKPGMHGGIIIPIGSDSYHAEAVIEKTGDFRLLMLGKDESRVMEVDLQAVKAYVRVAGNPEAVTVEMAAVPQEGDTAEKTSQFAGILPESLRGQALDVTIPNLKIAGERFRIGFTTAAVHDEQMPAPTVGDELQSLYLTPGGQYTAADIAANGNVTAAVKFKGIPSSHNNKPKTGDRLCPISMTKANPAFTWIIGGKPYQFCCPPCIDEFVEMAKQSSGPLPEPESYVR